MSKKKQLARKPLATIVPGWMKQFFAFSFLFIVPVVYYQKVVDVTLTPKFFVLAGLLLIVYLFSIISPIYKIPSPWVIKQSAVLSLFALILISVISLFGAINPSEGLFDIYRMLALLLFLVACTSLLINTGSLKVFYLPVLILSLVYVGVGYYDYFTLAFGDPRLEAILKINGIMSNKNAFSGGIYFLLPLLVYHLLTAELKYKYLSAVLVFLLSTLILLFQTRSIYVAIFLFGLMLLILIFIFRKKIFIKKNKEKLLQGIILTVGSFLLAFIVSLLITNYSISHPKSMAGLQGIEKPLDKTEGGIESIDERVASIFHTKADNSSNTRRLEIWKITFKMIREHPFLGVGAGNWKILVPSYYESDYLKNYYHNWRRPHNDFIWIFAEKGIFGILSYLAFFVFLLWYSIKILRKSSDYDDLLLVMVIISGIIAYCAYAFFSFPYERIELQLYLMFFSSLVLWKYQQSFPGKAVKSKQGTTVFSIIAIIFLISALIFGRIWINTETAVKFAYATLNRGMYEQTIKAIDLGYSPIAQIDPRNGPVLWFKGNANLMLNRPELAEADLETSLTQNPYSMIVLRDLGTAYRMQARDEEAIEMYQQALDIYPSSKETLVNMAYSYYAMGEYQLGLDCLYLCLTDQENPELNNLINTYKEKLFGSQDGE